MKKVSVIIPTKNEPNINELVSEVNTVLSKVSHEILVVDKSDIPPKLKGARLILQKSDGLGRAILEGVSHSNGGINVVIDGDFSHRPKDIPKLLERMNTYDIVIGSKYTNGGKSNDRWYRVFISKAYCSIANFILGLDVKDSMSGFSAARREVYKKIKPNPRGFKINLELLYKSKKFGFKTTEVPIKFLLPKNKGRSRNIFYEILINPGFREAFRTLRFIFELKLGLR